MADNNDLQQLGNLDSGDTSNTALAGQSDWEARFKGLQKQFNQLQASLSGKDATITRLQRERDEAKSGKEELATHYEGQLAEWRVKAETATSSLTSLQTEKETLAQKATRLEKEKATLSLLATHENLDVLPFYQTGMLKVDDLEGEALTAKLTEFRELLNNKSRVDFQNTMSGTKPAQVGAISVSVGGLSESELRVWMRDNPGHPEFKRYEDAWLDLVAKS